MLGLGIVQLLRLGYSRVRVRSNVDVMISARVRVMSNVEVRVSARVRFRFSWC